MRSLFGAVVVLGLSVALLARSVLAEAPPPMERRQASAILAALRKKPALKAQLATLRFYVEVAGGDSLEVPQASAPETTSSALDEAEQVLGSPQCNEVEPAALKAASLLLTEYGDALPVTLRAWTLGHQGKKAEAADLLVMVINQSLSEGPGCPSEHPDSSYHRVRRVSRMLDCLTAFAPKRDVSKQKKVLQRAETCASTNSAEG